ncbi:hypothetical protein DRQ33_03900 [bacterium]|nr:MAG: hypothetical protein DRQ33_03900 [bacterium]
MNNTIRKIFWAIFFISILISIISADSRDIELARRFLVIEKYEKAVDVLEPLYAQNPDDPEIRSLLVEAYTGAKMYDKLTSLLNNILLEEPNNYKLWIQLGGIYLSQNNPKHAMDAFDRAIAIAPNNSAIVVQIHSLLQQWSFIDEDIKFLRDARERFDDDNLFALQMARLYEIKGEFDEVVKEYSRYLKSHPDRFREVENRIKVTERTEEELQSLRKELNNLFDTQVPRWQPWSLIATVEIMLGNYSNALDAMINAEDERADAHKGRLMTAFVDEMIRIGQFEIAVEGARYLIANTGANYARTGRLYLARALKGAGDYTEALVHLDTLLMARIPPISQDAAILLAEILLENLNNPDSAQQVIDNFSETQKRGESLGEEGLFIKGKIFIYKKQFDKAKTFLNRALENNAQSEKLAYLLGMTYFFSGSYDTANTALHNIVARFPKSTMGNEAVELLLIMQTQKDMLDDIREPLYSMFVRDTASAVEIWQKLAEKNLASIGDFVLWKLGISQLSLGQEQAVNTFSELVDKFPESFYAPLALEQLAINTLNTGNTAGAIDIYTRIVNDYPDAVNIETVRKKLQEMGNL